MTDQYGSDWQQQPDPIGAHAASTADYGTPSYTVVSDAPSDVDSGDQGKAGAAKEQAAAVGQGAAQAGQQVASVAKDQAQNVAAEATNQAKDLMAQAKSELSEQASTQQGRFAELLRSLAGELESMAHHDGDQGMATNLAQQAASRTHDAASWLESGEPDHLLKDVQKFARQRPAAFLALAAGAGVLAGRLGRGVKDAGGNDTTGSNTTTTNTGSGASFGAATYSAQPVDPTAVEARPFASSQVEDYRPFSDTGDGL